MGSKTDSEVSAMQTASDALKELDDEEQRRVILWLIDKFKVTLTPAPSSLSKPSGAGTPSSSSGTESGGIPTVKIFMTQKKPQSFVERITCLAYYLTHYKGTTQFKTKTLSDLNKEAAQPTLSNASVFARDAVDSQYLSLAGGGKKQITTRGEAVVEALPDHDAVTKALRDHPLVGRKSKSGNKGKTKTKTKSE